MSTQHVKRLITFLGIGNYTEVRYEFDGYRAEKSPYVCRALSELLQPNEIKVLATELAEQKHATGLREALRGGNFPEPEFVAIPDGKNPRELWQQFEVLKTAMRGTEGSLMLDITHGFRSQPFFAAAVTAFVRAVDEIPPDIRICYGAFDAQDNDGVAPIWELTEFVTLLDWAQALRMFLQTGHAEEAAALSEKLAKQLAKTWAGRERMTSPPKLNPLGKALKAFGADLGTLRTGDLLIGRDGKESSAQRLWKAARDAEPDTRKHAAPLADILERVAGMTKPLVGERTDLSGEGGRNAIVALADLYVSLGRYLEAAATIREGWVNLHAGKAALCPGQPNFDKDQREIAEQRAGQHDQFFQEVSDRRNDFLHAQYRGRDGTQNAARVIKKVKELRDKFRRATASPRGSVFLNLSNHPSNGWKTGQTEAALALAEIIEDLPFPAVPPDAEEAEIAKMAETCADQVSAGVTYALVQGEFSLTVALLRKLQDKGVTCLAATTERIASEDAEGRSTRTYKFVRFREYPAPR